jgi:N-acetylglutamate synthase-like GNAT family acetyltransferase
MSEHIQAYMRKAAALNREVEQIGPFFATFTAHSDNPFLNYAIPDPGAEPGAGDIQALIAAFRRHERVPRLEYLPGLAPAVEPALLAAGFAVEDRLPLMDCPAGAIVDQPPPAGFELLFPATDEEHLGVALAQAEAFGEEPPTEAEIARARKRIADGGLAVYARDAATGEAAGGGACTPLRDGLSEVVGVAVREAYRKRGLGGAITLMLTKAAYDAGADTVFLTPAGDPQERVYARVGYRRIDSVLFLRNEHEGLRDEHEGLRDEHEGLRDEHEGLRDEHEGLGDDRIDHEGVS